MCLIYFNFSVSGRFDLRRPGYIQRDPDMIKQIAVKDFDHFEDHQSVMNEEVDKITACSLFLLKGAKWRDMRATLSPAFTGNKMRQMFELISECAEDYVKHFQSEAASGKKIDIELKEMFSRYANDVIATCAFGIQVNSLADPDNEFRTNGKKVLQFSVGFTILKMIFMYFFPKIAKKMGLKLLDKQVRSSFKSIILDTMDVRKRDNIYRPDMIHLLMQAREGSLKIESEEKSIEVDGFATVEESDVGKRAENRVWDGEEIVAQ